MDVKTVADIFPLDGIGDVFESGREGVVPVGAPDGGPLLEGGAELAGDEPGDGSLGKEEEFKGALGVGRIPSYGQDQGRTWRKGPSLAVSRAPAAGRPNRRRASSRTTLGR